MPRQVWLARGTSRHSARREVLAEGSIRRRFLVLRQEDDGSWSEADFTGTGFPGVFYLKYHLYRNSFPVYALARYSNRSRRAEEYVAMKFRPSEFRLRSGF